MSKPIDPLKAAARAALAHKPERTCSHCGRPLTGKAGCGHCRSWHGNPPERDPIAELGKLIDEAGLKVRIGDPFPGEVVRKPEGNPTTQVDPRDHVLALAEKALEALLSGYPANQFELGEKALAAIRALEGK